MMSHVPVPLTSLFSWNRLPAAMRLPPELDEARATPPRRPRLALLIAPFYPKSPYGSLGKHNLTPALPPAALAGATPAGWEFRFWDENMLQGHPPCDPFPEVVGITVNVTSASRAYALADWYRQRGAKVVLGGLHVAACPEEAAPHADALAHGEGVQLWPRILADAEAGCLQPRYTGNYHEPFEAEPPVRRAVLDSRDYLTTASMIATRGCNNRCGFCYLATRGVRMPYQTRTPESVAREFSATGEPYGVFLDNNLGVDKAYLRALCHALAPLEKIWYLQRRTKDSNCMKMGSLLKFQNKRFYSEEMKSFQLYKEMKWNQGTLLPPGHW
jgi:hypothetical protein